MSLFTRSRATLIYLTMVLILGGASAAGLAANFLLQLLGAGLIGWSLWGASPQARPHTGMRRFAVVLAVLAAVQFLPLPPVLWSHLPGRGPIAAGFEMMDAPLPWLNLSLSPWHSLASLTWWLPALALVIGLRAPDAPNARQLVAVIAWVAGVSVLLGALQRTGGIGYIYEITNFGEGPGFFANSNHQGSFLLCAVSLLGGQLAGEAATSRRFDWRAGENTARLGLLGVLLLGVLVSGSLACVALLIPVVMALALIFLPTVRVPMPLVLGAMALMIAGFAAFLVFGPVANDLTRTSTTVGISRQEFLLTGSRILRDFAPFGSGLGTFPELYPRYENVAQIGSTFVNHAHDDLLEILIETGIFGLAAVAMFLAWFLPRATALWRGDRVRTLALAASVAIGVELIHSLVDYPLRTAAMSSVMAIACTLLVRAQESARQHRGQAHRPSQAVDRSLIRI